MSYPLRVEVRPLLTSGGCGSGPGSIFILLADDLTKAEAAKTLWHEVVHILKRAGGDLNHDEDQVDAAAEKLAAACPEVLAWCGVEEKFK